MERQTFVLTRKRVYRHAITIYMPSNVSKSKYEKRNVKFSTEHKVSEKERTKNARLIVADFTTDDERLIDAMYRDSGYGKTFTHVDDPKGERKRESLNITPMDAKKVALRNLFDNVGLAFDPTKDVEVLQQEFSSYLSATKGVVITAGTAKNIPHKEVNVQESMQDQILKAREVFKEKYNETIPDEFANDLTLLDGLSNPDFDAKAYIEEKSVSSDDNSDGLPEDIEDLRQIYFTRKGKNVANPKKNDAAWIKEQLQKADEA